MTYSEEQENHVIVANLGGEVDSITSSELEKRVLSLLDGGAKNLLLDCTRLSYINSAGLRIFLLAAKQLDGRGSLAFCGLAPNVRFVFETIGFDRILTIHPDRATAIKAMNPGLPEIG